MQVSGAIFSKPHCLSWLNNKTFHDMIQSRMCYEASSEQGINKDVGGDGCEHLHCVTSLGKMYIQSLSFKQVQVCYKSHSWINLGVRSCVLLFFFDNLKHSVNQNLVLQLIALSSILGVVCRAIAPARLKT